MYIFARRCRQRGSSKRWGAIQNALPVRKTSKLEITQIAMLQLCLQVVLFEEGEDHVVVNAYFVELSKRASEVAMRPIGASVALPKAVAE
jgi:hypothetical protein